MTKEMRARTEKSWRELCKRERPASAVEWPWPPRRLTDRLRPDPVVVCECGEPTPTSRAWCSLCGSAL